MKLINRSELQKRIAGHSDLKLVFVLGDWQYRSAHIPGSVNIPCTSELFASGDALAGLGQDDEIVVYCSNEACYASISFGYFLDQRGYKNVSRYAGGLQDWYEAGLPLAGEMV